MNLTKLFEMQRELDRRIVKEKGLENEYLLPRKILALQVELGECANEWRGFKFWSKNQKPRTEFTQPCFECNGEDIGMECHRCEGEGYEVKSNPLLEEYIDCLHFILSIGLIDDLYTYIGAFDPVTSENITQAYNRVFMAVVDVSEDFDTYEYQMLLEFFFGLGKMLGFTWEQIEAAYIAKNEVNHNRQSTGY
ncbi:dUTP diphosphatase [Paenibacillus sp. BR1-192]|uniref:dUTP diphosphatase n=1 Tax=Paenibacillus sp. BR1-192 TaxID=3032287 RepID=UPI00240D5F73|nr:dUTP diphosphatase [Paenibacillus sp. BR1-192]WFB57500.1 dUTP diphosphatase [Paenibacillus sp. BR1-192]